MLYGFDNISSWFLSCLNKYLIPQTDMESMQLKTKSDGKCETWDYQIYLWMENITY